MDQGSSTASDDDGEFRLDRIDFDKWFGEGTNFTVNAIGVLSDSDWLYYDLFIYIAICIIGCTGNIVTIWLTSRKHERRKAAKMVLTSRAVSDLILIGFCAPIEVIKLHYPSYHPSGLFCRATYFIEILTAIACISNMSAIAIERYFGVLHPVFSRLRCKPKRGQIILTVVWTLSVILALPCFFTVEIGSFLIPSLGNARVNTCNEGASAVFVTSLYYLVVMLLVPLCIMTYTYVCIAVVLYSTSHPGTPKHLLPFIRYQTNRMKRACKRRLFGDEETRTTGLLGTRWRALCPRCCFPTDDRLDGVEASNRVDQSGRRDDIAAAERGAARISRSRAREQLGNNLDSICAFAVGESAQQLIASRKSAMKLLCIILMFFICCWGPKLILNALLRTNTIIPTVQLAQWKKFFNMLPFFHAVFNATVFLYLTAGGSKNWQAALETRGCGWLRVFNPIRFLLRTCCPGLSDLHILPLDEEDATGSSSGRIIGVIDPNAEAFAL